MSDSEGPALPEGAVQNGDGSVDYTLQWPISFKQGGADATVSSVTVRRKRLEDNLAIKMMTIPADIMRELIVRLCGLEAKVAVMMDDTDTEAVGAIIESFTTPGQPIGNPAPEQ